MQRPARLRGHAGEVDAHAPMIVRPRYLAIRLDGLRLSRQNEVGGELAAPLGIFAHVDGHATFAQVEDLRHLLRGAAKPYPRVAVREMMAELPPPLAHHQSMRRTQAVLCALERERLIEDEPRPE